jgi:hypothetical protein
MQTPLSRRIGCALRSYALTRPSQSVNFQPKSMSSGSIMGERRSVVWKMGGDCNVEQS